MLYASSLCKRKAGCGTPNRAQAKCRAPVRFQMNPVLFILHFENSIQNFRAAPWCKRLAARLPQLGSRVRVSVTSCGFHGVRNWVWIGFSRGFPRFPLPQISLRHFSTFISFVSFYFIRRCHDASTVVGQHTYYSQNFNIGASTHLIPRSWSVPDMSWGYSYLCYVCGRRGRLARGIKWRACDVGEAKEGLEN